MVDGHEAMTPLLAVDLDGTYIRGNTLHIYLRRAMAWHLRGGRPWRTAAIAGLLAMRRLRLISHASMKFAALRQAGRHPELLADFSRHAAALVNPEVVSLIELYRSEGCKVLLATAAADFYVPHVWRDDFVATAIDDNKEHCECRGERKAAAVAQWCLDHDCRLLAVITDHTDDLPLLESNPNPAHNYLVDRATGHITRYSPQRP